MTWTDFKPQTLASLQKRLSRRPYADHSEAFINGSRVALSAWTWATYNLPPLQDSITAAEGLAEAADTLLKCIKRVRRSMVLEAGIDAEIVFMRHAQNLEAMQDALASTEGFSGWTDVMHKRIKKAHADLVWGNGARRLSHITKEIEALAGAAHRVAGSYGDVKSEIHPMLREKAMVHLLAQVWRRVMKKKPSITPGSTFEAICVEIGKNEFGLAVGPASMKAAKTPE